MLEHCRGVFSLVVSCLTTREFRHDVLPRRDGTPSLRLLGRLCSAFFVYSEYVLSSGEEQTYE